MLKGFKEFVLRGNVLDLAIAVIIGTAFNKVVGSLAQDVLMPFISIMVGRVPDFSSWKLGIVSIGSFLNATVNFLVVATAIYFLVVAPLNTLKRKEGKSKQEAPPTPPELSEEIKLLREIVDLLKALKAK